MGLSRTASTLSGCFVTLSYLYSETNTVSTLPVHTMATPTFNWSESTFITTRRPAANMSRAPCWSTWNQVPWTRSDPDLSDKFSDRITSYLDSREPVTTGLRVITPREPNWSTPY